MTSAPLTYAWKDAQRVLARYDKTGTVIAVYAEHGLAAGVNQEEKLRAIARDLRQWEIPRMQALIIWGAVANESPPSDWPQWTRQAFEQYWDEAANAEPSNGHRKIALTPASLIKVRPVHWLWEGRLALGTLALIGGREGIGKSTVSYTIAAQVTRGTLAGRYHGTPKGVIVAATEDSWEHTIVPRLMAADADLDRVYRVDVTTCPDCSWSRSSECKPWGECSHCTNCTNCGNTGGSSECSECSECSEGPLQGRCTHSDEGGDSVSAHVMDQVTGHVTAHLEESPQLTHARGHELPPIDLSDSRAMPVPLTGTASVTRHALSPANTGTCACLQFSCHSRAITGAM